jgi:hypothetical protein
MPPQAAARRSRLFLASDICAVPPNPNGGDASHNWATTPPSAVSPLMPPDDNREPRSQISSRCSRFRLRRKLTDNIAVCVDQSVNVLSIVAV